MSALLNEKHERFCREVARGASASEAYRKAGFAGHRQNASRMMTNDDIKRRIAEIKSQRDTDNKNGRDPGTGQFLTGSVGNPLGRPKGSRNRLGEQFIEDLRNEWVKSGAQALERMAQHDATGFVKVVASVLPKEVDATLEVKVGLFEEVRDFNEAWDIARQVIGADDDNPLIELTPNDDNSDALDS
jgi:hypothetical protein